MKEEILEEKEDVEEAVEEDVEVLERNDKALKKDGKGKNRVKKAKRGFFAITKYNFVAGAAYLVQTILDKTGVLGKIIGASLGQVATNVYNTLCSFVSRYIIDNNLFKNSGFLKIFKGNGPLYENELGHFNEFIQNPNPSLSQAMSGGVAVEGVIEQSTLMNIVGTIIQFVIQNPVLVIMPTAALSYEIIRKIIISIKNAIKRRKNKGSNEETNSVEEKNKKIEIPEIEETSKKK